MDEAANADQALRYTAVSKWGCVGVSWRWGREKKSGLVFVFAADVLLLPKAFDLGHLVYTSSIVHEPPFTRLKVQK